MTLPSVGAVGAHDVETNISVVRYIIAHCESEGVFKCNTLTTSHITYCC